MTHWSKKIATLRHGASFCAACHEPIVRALPALRTGLFAWLALIAFLLKAVIPAGYMASADGGVVTCGEVRDLLAPLAHGEGKQPAKASEAPCVFAGLAAPALTPGVSESVVAPLRVAFDAPRLHPRAERPQLNPAAPPPARGPPLYA